MADTLTTKHCLQKNIGSACDFCFGLLPTKTNPAPSANCHLTLCIYALISLVFPLFPFFLIPRPKSVFLFFFFIFLSSTFALPIDDLLFSHPNHCPRGCYRERNCFQSFAGFPYVLIRFVPGARSYAVK